MNISFVCYINVVTMRYASLWDVFVFFRLMHIVPTSVGLIATAKILTKAQGDKAVMCVTFFHVCLLISIQLLQLACHLHNGFSHCKMLEICRLHRIKELGDTCKSQIKF